MTPISAVIITFNEERNILRCIESLRGVADEIVVLDSFSSDRTKEICEELSKDLPVRFYQKEWIGYTHNKNYLNSLTTHDYLFSIDADEALDEELKAAIISEKNKGLHGTYAVNRLTNYCGKWIKHSGWYPDRKIRLYNRKKAQWYSPTNLHEIIKLDHPQSHQILEGDLLHWAYDTYTEHYLKIDNFTSIAAKFYVLNVNKKIGLDKIIINPTWNFFKAYIIKRGFLDGFEGYIIAKFHATGTFLKYAKIRELQKQNKNS